MAFLLIAILPKTVGAIPAGTDTLPHFRLVYSFGDEGTDKYEINIYKKGGKYYADNISPVFYVGSRSTGAWSAELNAGKIAACLTFLGRMRSQPEECPEVSTSIKDYLVTTGTETIHVRGDCDWDGMDFFDLRSALFTEKFADLDARRLALGDSLSRKLTGKWYFAPIKTKFKAGEYFTLSRAPGPGLSCTWQFGVNSSFKSSCNDVLNLEYSTRYVLNLDGNNYFEIQGGATTDANGNTTIRNFGAAFTIESVNESELKLKFLRR